MLLAVSWIDILYMRALLVMLHKCGKYLLKTKTNFLLVFVRVIDKLFYLQKYEKGNKMPF
jgi:hypothetical protein